MITPSYDTHDRAIVVNQGATHEVQEVLIGPIFAHDGARDPSDRTEFFELNVLIAIPHFGKLWRRGRGLRLYWQGFFSGLCGSQVIANFTLDSVWGFHCLISSIGSSALVVLPPGLFVFAPLL
jgi:hypothetical protein